MKKFIAYGNLVIESNNKRPVDLNIKIDDENKQLADGNMNIEICIKQLADQKQDLMKLREYKEQLQHSYVVSTC